MRSIQPPEEWPEPGFDTTSQPAIAGEDGGHFDGMKARVDLLDPWFAMGIAWVLAYGAHKYGERNWEAGIRVTRLLASVERHIAEIKAGVDYDPESGLPHWAHAACCLYMMQSMIYEHLELDDRNGNPAILADLAEQGCRSIRAVKGDG